MSLTVSDDHGGKQPRTESVICDLCGADDYEVLFEGRDRLHNMPGSFPVVQCRQCRLVYLNPRPAEATLADYYPVDYSPHQREGGLVQLVQRWLRRRQARHIKKAIPIGGRVLEIGCGTGDLLVPLQSLGVLVSGVEISSYAAEIVRRNHGLDVHTGTLFDAPYAPHSFDAVVMRHVIEHFPSARRALDQIASLLKPGGVLFITTPNFESFDGKIFGRYWHDLDPPRHLAVFSVTTLDRMLKNTGFEMRAISYSMVPNDWIYSMRNLLVEYLGDGPVPQIFSIRNPFMLLFFLPFGMLQKLFKKSGRIDVVARKSP